ncbi:hypothetical protein M752DRAFT_264783 [Aspergillus phoenicis ATCC 13157]|uniref:Secreted protein n=1 Tax=Aspergillus phoenicis ATCC 13157 TaxID=1353007 RepID=A0A370PNW4_ASPPH|nr:hypothetical protein M752DRAFT_264783 [Aspergillus phoenicis ATCC 13157]
MFMFMFTLFIGGCTSVHFIQPAFPSSSSSSLSLMRWGMWMGDVGTNGRSMFHYDGAKIETDCMGCCATNTASLRWVIHVSSVMKPDSISTGWSSAKSAWMEQKAARKVDDDTHHNAKNISHTSLSMRQE